jgi:hypothetical protein
LPNIILANNRSGSDNQAHSNIKFGKWIHFIYFCLSFSPGMYFLIVITMTYYYRLKVSENRALRIFGSMRDEIWKTIET